MSSLRVLILFFMLVLIPHGQSWAKNTVLRFPETIEVSHQIQYRLLDIAEVENPTESVIRQLWQAEIPQKWTQGSRFTLTEQQIMQVLRQNSFNKKNVEIIISEILKPKKSEEILSKTHLERMIRTINSSLCAQCEFKVEIHNMPKVLLSEWEWDPFSTLFRGSFTTLIRMPASRWSGWLTGSVQWHGSALEVKKNLNFGQKVTLEDLKVSLKDITYQKDIILNSEEVVGRVAARTIGIGSVLRASDLKKEEAVKRGQVVKAILGDQDFEISLSTLAEESGTLGDRIRIKNLETQKMLTGEIIDFGVVRVK